MHATDRLGERGDNAGDPDLGHEHGDYTYDFGGTSSACPGGAGLAALMLAKNSARTASEIRSIIADTCDQIDTANGQYNASGHSIFYGYGRVNAARAVNVA